MVDDMVVRHVVEEEAAHPAKEVAVHCRGRAPLEVPLRLAIVRQLRVRVVKVRDHDEPATVRYHVRGRRIDVGVPCAIRAEDRFGRPGARCVVS